MPHLCKVMLKAFVILLWNTLIDTMMIMMTLNSIFTETCRQAGTAVSLLDQGSRQTVQVHLVL